MTYEIMERARVDEITGGRSIAIAHWLRAYDQFHESTAAAAIASIGGAIPFTVPVDDRYADTGLARAFVAHGAQKEWDGHDRVEFQARDRFEQLITHSVDRRCWTHLMETLGFDQLLDRQAREELRDSLQKEPPAFTSENCASTFSNIWENRRDIYLRGIANAFSRLDRRFRSHDGFKIGARLILERALSEYGSWHNYDRRDTLHDIERVFRELDGKGPLPSESGIAARISDARRSQSTPYVIEGDYFRVRVFGNGNLHLWFERKDLHEAVNKLLAEYYGEAIGDGYNETKADDAPEFHLTPAKDFGAFMSSEAVAERVQTLAEVRKGERVLEPSAGTGVLAKVARDAGAAVVCIEVQPGMAHELRVLHGFTNVENADFLTMKPAQLGAFDKIIMNPPFDRGRDCDHVRHAYEFLRPGGVLIAVMSARAEYGEDKRHKALHKIVDQCKPAYGWMKWHDLPAQSFAHAGTNVNTVVLAIRKPN